MKYTINNGLFVGKGIKCRTVHLSDKACISAEWAEKQDASIEEYQQTHTIEYVSDLNKSIMPFLGGIFQISF